MAVTGASDEQERSATPSIAEPATAQEPPPIVAQAQPAALAIVESTVVEVGPVTPRETDPSEISAPPTQPKRGWWRRGA
jgi:ribonuclease E